MSQNETAVGWTPQVNGRGTFDVIWSCTLTIFLCCWTSVCVNIPALSDSRLDRFRDKFYIALIGILGPDFLLILAMGQWESARHSVKQFRSIKVTGKEWTMRQAFFADMGGYMLKADKYPAFSIHAEQLFFLVSEGFVAYPVEEEEDIDDKNKRDSLARLLTVAQALVFAITTITRVGQKLAITTLEITTLAFIFAMLAISCFWKHKPQDINRPIILYSTYTIEEIVARAGYDAIPDYKNTPLEFLDPPEWFCSVFWQYQLRLFRTVFRFSIPKISQNRPANRRRSDDFPSMSMPVELCCGWLMLFYSAIFVAGWNMTFPTQIEEIMWRVASLVMLAFACLGGLFFFYIDHKIIRKAQPRKQALRGGHTDVTMKSLIPLGFMVPSVIFAALYCFARVYVLVEDVIGLRSVPASAFETVDWTLNLPHS